VSEGDFSAGRLEGRRILIVGGGQENHGMDDPPLGNGRAMALLFAREGASVAVADLNAESAEETSAGVREAGVAAVTITADASSEADVQRMIAEASEGLGGLDGIVLNVGIAAGFGFEHTSVEDWDQVMAVNLRSHFLGCKHGIPAMDGGAIVLVGSVAGMETMPFPAYAASKAALESVTRHAAVEAAPEVRVNLLVPGLIDTPLGRLASQASEGRKRVRIPLQRQGTAWEIARAASFLISAESSYMTGQHLVIDGGLTVGFRA
jgi:NAD(P)-dependent dehydrogenase (short-subunit alcohol dehydrogenase family)